MRVRVLGYTSIVAFLGAVAFGMIACCVVGIDGVRSADCVHIALSTTRLPFYIL